MSDEPGSIVELLDLTPHGIDTWLGVSPTYGWGRVYGGQVVAQGLRAAAHTVDPAFGVHSLHAYFIRGGVVTEPIRYEVDRVRDGRSFLTRRVVARQSGGAILTMAASFQVREDADDVAPIGMPDVPGPGDGVDETWSPIFDHVRIELDDPRPARARSWLRIAGALPDDDGVVSACALAYLSDDVPMSSIAAADRRYPDLDGADFDSVWVAASLDHAVWFHTPARTDRWLLADMTTQRLAGSRGLATGPMFDADGHHVATVAQEGLLRVRSRPN